VINMTERIFEYVSEGIVPLEPKKRCEIVDTEVVEGREDETEENE
jgi:hypothetical protein